MEWSGLECNEQHLERNDAEWSGFEGSCLGWGNGMYWSA